MSDLRYIYATIRKIEFRDRDTTEDEMDEIRAEVNAKSMKHDDAV